jgi:hypothetical protein
MWLLYGSIKSKLSGYYHATAYDDHTGSIQRDVEKYLADNFTLFNMRSQKEVQYELDEGRSLSWYYRIHNHCIHVIEFPPYSPGMSPMENIWIELEKRVEKHNATTLDKLQDAISEEWNKTSIDFLKTLSHSMSKRCSRKTRTHTHLFIQYTL